jgi:hypothetical protein
MIETDIGVYLPAASGPFVYIAALIKILGEAALAAMDPGWVRV